MSRSSVVVVGGGFAGYFAARTLERLVPAIGRPHADQRTDHLCYSPLLPEVASGRSIRDESRSPPRCSARSSRPRWRTWTSRGGHSTWSPVRPRRTGPVGPLGPDTGSVTRTLPTPGVDNHALGLKTLVEAQFVHDHVLRQLELATARRTRRAQGSVDLRRGGRGLRRYGDRRTAPARTVTQLDRFPRVSRDELRWVLLDLAPAVLPELGPRLGRAALAVIRGRGWRCASVRPSRRSARDA